MVVQDNTSSFSSLEKAHLDNRMEPISISAFKAMDVDLREVLGLVSLLMISLVNFLAVNMAAFDNKERIVKDAEHRAFNAAKRPKSVPMDSARPE
jgi:hypothetical protein